LAQMAPTPPFRPRTLRDTLCGVYAETRRARRLQPGCEHPLQGDYGLMFGRPFREFW
jgi:hypothetical protein